ncbi:tyrosine-type recombinase/integrase [Waterburya agarophytonicola K14]|uniref:Tyrosine-type recombinase/integrase n=1 Tax=Waterburya agarophytonicola KI4 TaxID=2874699 RepID=A0A964BUH2_9CYAN|nr:tyrosine-type recombinase/integrase [Waterburya agarophytonicola]MCC0178748.1 tyrosine-type recombinase/integrase [Waterburya agarophytonicola KI4]
MNLTLQKGIDPITNQTIWLMLDEDYEVVTPIQQYLTFLTTTKSPNTVKAYAYALKYWWIFLAHKSLDWREVNLSDMGDFAYWLRVGEATKVISTQSIEAIRSERTVNHAITAVTNFYEYHIANKTVDFKQFERFYLPHGISRVGGKGLLTGIAKSKPLRQKLVKLKEKKKFPGCLTDEQISTLVNACNRLRDKLIILMLNSTGIRKGELLSLMHDDVGDFDQHFIQVVQRDNHPNGARAKGQERTIPIASELLSIYNDYLIYEYPDTDSGYVFVNIWYGKIGQPINPYVVNTMFRRLSEKTGIHVYPHLFRHTYATRLLKAGYAPERVKHLLGHASIQTTLDIYSHVITEANLCSVIEKEEAT